MALRGLVRLWLALALGLMALPAVPAPAWAEEAATAPPPPSAFQRLLNRHGIPLALPREGRAIVVNVPAFELITFEDGDPVFRSRVIVGTPWHRTPILRTYTTAVRFRPTWRPTPSMIASGEYRDRVWPPGESNPLGLAAVRLQPGLLVYLHDTNRRELFEQENRALSHGCIRVQRWSDLVAWVLDINLETVMALAHGSRTFDWPTEPIPVIIGYFTEFPDETGRIVSHPDIYRRLSDAAPPEPSGTGPETAQACPPFAPLSDES